MIENLFWVSIWTTILMTASSVILFRNWFKAYKLQQALETLVRRADREVTDCQNVIERQKVRIAAYENTEVYGIGINFALPTMSLMFNKGSLDEDRIQERYAELRHQVDLAKVMVLPTGMQFMQMNSAGELSPTPPPRARAINLDD